MRCLQSLAAAMLLCLLSMSVVTEGASLSSKGEKPGEAKTSSGGKPESGISGKEKSSDGVSFSGKPNYGKSGEEKSSGGKPEGVIYGKEKSSYGVSSGGKTNYLKFEEEKSSGGKPEGGISGKEKSSDGVSSGGKSNNGKFEEEKSPGGKPEGGISGKEKSFDSVSSGGKPNYGKSGEEKYSGGKSVGGKSGEDKSSVGKSSGRNSNGGKSGEKNSWGIMSSGGKSEGGISGEDQFSGERSAGRKLKGGKSREEKFSAESHQGENLSVERPGKETSSGGMSSGGKSGEEKSSGGKSEGGKSEGGKSGEENSSGGMSSGGISEGGMSSEEKSSGGKSSGGKSESGENITERPCGIYTKGCHQDALCLRKGNTEYCTCKPGYYGNGVDSCGAACTCTGSGDPHYKTFDGNMIHFQGICKYVLSELAIGSPCDYRVLVQNEHRHGNTRVSYTKRVDLEIRNTTISLRKDRALFVNRERKYTPLEAEDLTFSIFMRGFGEIVVQTSCKVVVIYDGSQRVSVTVPEVYGRNMTGLCGNCNSDRGDDFLTKNKLDVSKEQDRYALIGNSFVVPDPETPLEICAVEDVKITCSPEFKGLAASNDYCGLLKNTTGPFGDFIKKEPTISEKIWDACLFDVCSYEEDLVQAQKTACDALENFAKTIQDNGLGNLIWRTAARCPLTCGENMQYSINVGALHTCSDGVQVEKIDVSPVDGCTCKPGFVQSGDKCVHKEECGCKVGNQYLPVGETFVTEDCMFLKQCQNKNGKSEIVSVETRPACHVLAQCKPNEITGQYTCQCQKGSVGDGIKGCIAACGNAKKPCHPNAICSKGKGKQPDQCRCKEGYYGDGTENCTKSCECVASGDPHYTTFDGQKIHFQGLCKYTLASIPSCFINIEVKNQPVPGKNVSTTKLLDVKLSSTNIRIGQKKKLLINGEIAYAPVEGVGYRIYEKGSMVVETDCGVIVMFDGASTAHVLIPSQYENTVTGICGNCDGIQNDFRTKNGRIVSGETNKYTLIGDSYAVPDETDQGPESCQTENIDPSCPQEWESKKRSNEYCGLILDPKGPFGPCLAKYPEIAKTDGVISDCTYDVCANFDDPKNAQEAACTALAMMAYSCQQKSDIDVIVWRKPDFCPLKECGLNMVYNPAITESPATCQDPMRRTPCHAGLSEGCECKPGFFRSGAACVPREECGCVVQRKYYPLNTTVTSSDCRKKYVCVHKDGSSYMQKLEDSPPCGEKATCRLNDEGYYQCQCDKNYNGDGITCETCGRETCHANADCVNGKCICKSGYKGDGVKQCERRSAEPHLPPPPPPPPPPVRPPKPPGPVEQCLRDPAGINYWGTRNYTASGKPCQPWYSMTPHPHPYRKILEGDVNFCRNVPLPYRNPSYKPWCYVDDPYTLREFCDISNCGEEDKPKPKPPKDVGCYKHDAAGREYEGPAIITQSGRLCRKWNSLDRGYSYADNFCRNPSGMKKKPWCYTDDPETDWEYCDIPFCNFPPSKVNDTCSVTETTTGCSTVKIIKGDCFYSSNFESECRYVVIMIDANTARIHIGDTKVIELNSSNKREYADCAIFKFDYKKVTIREPTCGWCIKQSWANMITSVKDDSCPAQ